MNETRVELPDEIDINVGNVARVYDFLLGGAHNFASDYMIDAGIRQFLGLGSGAGLSTWTRTG